MVLWRFARAFPVNFLPVLFAAIVAGVLAWLIHPLVLLLAAAYIFDFFRKFLPAARVHFWYGCANPAAVVSVSPPRIAVYTDLSAVGRKEHPVLKVVDQPLGCLDGGIPPVGTRLATVSMYCQPMVDWHWSDFVPIAVGLVTDAKSARAVMDRVPPENWDRLEHGLRFLPDSPEPRTYPLPTLDA
jgi:hypothetical protein